MEIPRPVPGNQLLRPQIWPPLQCPRCDSTNTKFCYFNNYSRLQPRHLCKACRRHWTEGGTLRNVPVGGGHKNKRNKATTAIAATAAAAATTATATAAAATTATSAAAAATTATSAAAAAAAAAATTATSAAAAATTATSAAAAAAAAATTATTAAATLINSSSINDPTEILHRVPLRPPPPPVALADYGIMSTLMMSSLQSDQIGNIAAEPNTTVSTYRSTPAQVLFFGYSDEGLGTMSSASNAWHVAPHAQPPPASSGGSEAVPAALEASATNASGFWMSGWPDEEVSDLTVTELNPPLTGDDL